MGVDVGDEKIRIVPRDVRRGEDTRWVGIEDLVPLGFDDEEVEARAIRTRLVVTIGIGSGLLTSSALLLGLRLDDSLDTMMRNSGVHTIGISVVLKELNVVDT